MLSRGAFRSMFGCVSKRRWEKVGLNRTQAWQPRFHGKIKLEEGLIAGNHGAGRYSYILLRDPLRVHIANNSTEYLDFSFNSNSIKGFFSFLMSTLVKHDLVTHFKFLLVCKCKPTLGKNWLLVPSFLASGALKSPDFSPLIFSLKIYRMAAFEWRERLEKLDRHWQSLLSICLGEDLGEDGHFLGVRTNKKDNGKFFLFVNASFFSGRVCLCLYVCVWVCVEKERERQKVSKKDINHPSSISFFHHLML